MPKSKPPIQRASAICDRKVTPALATLIAKAMPAMRCAAPCSLLSQVRACARSRATAPGGVLGAARSLVSVRAMPAPRGAQSLNRGLRLPCSGAAHHSLARHRDLERELVHHLVAGVGDDEGVAQENAEHAVGGDRV